MTPLHHPDRSVFLIEDDQDIRSSIIDILADEGITTNWAANGADALEKLSAAETKPSLILLDLRLPIKDGFQFREEQMRDPRLAGIPVVVLSADGKLREKTSSMGDVDLLRKPVDIDELIRTVRQKIQ